ncbi:hypothetical protein OF83DRAFT_100852 [Amylostereum chailletii]|nr:hypothetical protein OF83DRAFT_100852 [Amylostereum chailletii]
MKLTAERAEARAEKQARALREPNIYADWDKDIIRIRDDDSSENGDEPLSTRRGRAQPAPSSSRRQPSASTSGGVSAPASRASSSRTMSTPLPKSSIVDSSDDDVAELLAQETRLPSKSRPRSKTRQVPKASAPFLSNAGPSRRTKLEDEFNRSAKEHGAASVQIVNEVDDEDIPDLPTGFKWVETGYEYVKGIGPLPTEFLAGCTCSGPCGRDGSCSCQAQSELPGDDGPNPLKRPYTAKGLLHAKLTNYPYQFHVNECNENCSCKQSSVKCPNRVAQQPRDVPVVIFKTANGRGWGLRATVDLPKGKILGTYTGQLTPRKDVDTHGSKYNYMFDLDYGENTRDKQGAWSVNALYTGNWSRIHQGANPEDMRPYIVFAAKTDIPAYTELTIDYKPELPEDSSDEDVVMVDAGEEPTRTKLRCMCGAAGCRQEFTMEY